MIKKIVLASLLLGSAGAANAAGIVNGGFEMPGISNSCCNTVPGNGTLPGWTVTAGNVNVVNGTFGATPSGTNLAAEGNQYLDLVGEGGVGAISQTFDTVQKQVYRLTFSYAHNLFNGLASASANFSVGALSGSVTHTGGTTSDLGWSSYTGYFTATGATSALSFVNTAGDGTNAGLLLDDVSISAVPEPASWVMMIGGFGFVGASMRRRRRATLAIA